MFLSVLFRGLRPGLLRSDYAVIGKTRCRCHKPRIGHRSSGIVCKGAEESLSDKVGVPRGWGLGDLPPKNQAMTAMRFLINLA